MRRTQMNSKLIWMQSLCMRVRMHHAHAQCTLMRVVTQHAQAAWWTESDAHAQR